MTLIIFHPHFFKNYIASRLGKQIDSESQTTILPQVKYLLNVSQPSQISLMIIEDWTRDPDPGMHMAKHPLWLAQSVNTIISWLIL